METNKNPWRNGIYIGSLIKGFIFKVTGETCQGYSTAYLDYPDEVIALFNSTWRFGDFGPADEETVKAAGGGIKNFNFLSEGAFRSSSKGKF